MKLRAIIKWVVVSGVLVAAGTGATIWWKKGTAESKEAEPAKTTIAAKRGPIRQVVQCNGRVVSNLDVDIKCRASGQVIKMPFDVSDKVKEGDLLLELDPVDQQRQVQQAEANLAASKARLAQAQVALAVAEKTLTADKMKSQAVVSSAKARTEDTAAKAKREQQLHEKKFSSQEGVETAETAAVQAEQDLKSAQANLESLEAQTLNLESRRQDINLYKAQLDNNEIALALAKRQLEYTKIFSPIDGVVATRPIQIGTIISSGISNVGGGTTVLTLSDLSRVFILGSVDESDIGLVELGQKAEITADSFPRKRFEGKVTRIATKGVSVSNVVTFETRVEVLNENKKLLKPEMTGNMSIIIAEKEDTLLIPANCITRDRKRSLVSLKKPDGTFEEQHEIEVGITDGVQTEVVGGLNEGDEVLVQKPEDESKWRAGDDHSQMRQRMMMMRTMGGGGPMGAPMGGRGGGRR